MEASSQEVGYGSTEPRFPGTVVSAPEFAPSAWKRTVDGVRVQCSEAEADYDRVDILWAMLPGARHHVECFQPSRHPDHEEAVDIHIGSTRDGIQLEILSQLRVVEGVGLRRVIFHVMTARPAVVRAVVRETRRRARSRGVTGGRLDTQHGTIKE